jgi:hypothetical protein
LQRIHKPHKEEIMLKKAGRLAFHAVLLTLLGGTNALAQDPIDAPTLVPRVAQSTVEQARRAIEKQCVRRDGLRVFGNPNTLADGIGDGPFDPNERPLDLAASFLAIRRLQALNPNAIALNVGNRVTFPGTTFARVFGLDSQSCGECHSVRSARSVPTDFAIGGTNMLSQPVLVLVGSVDSSDADGNGSLDFNGRVINAPSLWGVGGIELLAKEMTQDLQRLRASAVSQPGVPVRLVTRSGIDFGSLTCAASGSCDPSGLRGIRPELVVRPFGRRGDNPTIRDITNLAAAFDIGMQPAEIVGEDVDADQDGVANEFTAGEVSAMTLWQAGLEPPRQLRASRQAMRGSERFDAFGCASCHVRELSTRSVDVTFSFPEVFTDPAANVFQSLDLAALGFPRDRSTGGIRVKAFADLKLHDMGPGLTDRPAGAPGSSLFITIPLWGVADSAPYLHDGRAFTINDAILMHDGEGRPARDAYASASVADRKALLAFLDTLRAPENPNRAILSLNDRICR